MHALAAGGNLIEIDVNIILSNICGWVVVGWAIKLCSGGFLFILLSPGAFKTVVVFTFLSVKSSLVKY